MNKAERWTRKKKNWKKKELERRERELQRKEGERNKENCLNSNEVIFCNLQRTVAGRSLSDEWMRTKGKLKGRLRNYMWKLSSYCWRGNWELELKILTLMWPSSQFTWWLLVSFYVAVLFLWKNMQAHAFLVSHTQATVMCTFLI